MSECDECGELENNDTMYSTYHDQYVCEHCINNNYYFAYVRNGQDYVHCDNVVSVGDEHYHVDYLGHYDIYYCDFAEDYFHIDDLVSTAHGFVHMDYANALDHADTDGNNFAIIDEAHELSDGTWCHINNAIELQAEIDEADKEDEAQAETITQQGQQQNENI